jgi:outer membrane receptor for ferrienterochelin and colicins
VKKIIILWLALTGLFITLRLKGSGVGNEPGMTCLSGFVLTEEGAPVEAVEITVKGLSEQARTDANGYFDLHLVPRSERVSLTLYKHGFMPLQIDRISVDRAGKVDLKLIRLHGSPLEEMVITGTMTPKKYREVAVKTHVTSAATIERKGAESLADSLDLTTGVRVEDNCQNCAFTQVRINGMEGKYAQILINGRPTVSSLAGVYLLEQLPANMIEKLEVVKGGGSSLYGGNAVAGVINLITKEPLTPQNQISLQGTTIKGILSSKTSFNYNHLSKDRQTRSTIFINHQQRNPVDLNGDNFSDLGKINNFSGGASLVKDFSEIAGRLTLDFASHNEDRRGGNKLDQPEHFADVAESARTRRLDFSANWEQTFGKTLILKANTAFSLTKRNTYYGANQDPNAYGESENPLFYADIKADLLSVENHVLTLGVSWQQETLKDIIPAYNHIVDDLYSDVGIFVQDEWDLGKSWSVLGGVRFDKHSNLDLGIWSPRASLIFKGIRNLSVRGTFSTGFRAPQVFDEDLHITIVNGEPSFVINDANLRHESSRSWTFGLDYGVQVRAMLVSVSAGLFTTRVRDAFAMDLLDEDDGTHTYRRINSSGLEVEGVEVELGLNFAQRFTFNAGWTFQRSRYDEPETDFSSRNVFKTPDIYGFFRLGWVPLKGMDIGVDLNYTGPMWVPHYAGYIDEDRLEHTPSFWKVDLTARQKFAIGDQGGITLGLTLENAFNQFQNDLDMGAGRDAGYMYGPRFPRTFRFSLMYDF